MLRYRRICIVTNRYPAHPDDVASPFVRDFHLGLKKRGLEVSVFTPGYDTPALEWTEDVVRFRWAGGEKVVGSLNLSNPRELLQLLSFLRSGRRQLLGHLKKTRADACLALWALPSGWFAYQAKRKLDIPYSVWCLGSDIYVWAKKPVVRDLTKKVLQQAEQLFADGFDLSHRVTELSGRGCVFLPSMRRLPQQRREERLLDPAKVNFLYLGRWDKEKGLDDLLRAFTVVKNRLECARLCILGWGAFEGQMRKMIEELKLKQVVKVVGRVWTRSVACYIEQADCVIIPSKSDSIPLVFSEALQMRTPLIVSDVGDMGELAREFKLGKVVRPGDINGLAQAMVEFAREDEDYLKKVPQALRLLSPEKALDDYVATLATQEYAPTSNPSVTVP